MTEVPPLRVTQVVLELSLNGGIEAVAFEMQRAFRDAGIASRVLTSVTCETGPEIDRVLPVLTHIGSRGRLRHVGRAVTVPLFTLAASWRLWLTRQDGELVLSHGDTLVGDICVVHAVNRANLDTKRAAGGWRWRLNPMHLWVSWRDRVMIGGLRFQRYVALSGRIASELQRYYGVPRDRIVLIPNGVNLDRYTDACDDRDETRYELGLPTDKPVLLFVGHEFDRKGLKYAIDALAQPGLEDATLLVAGAGSAAPFQQQADQLGVGARLVFLGARSDLPRLYRLADAFVFPTAYESFALTCMEALACGLPVFAPHVGGIEDYLHDGVNGRVIARDGGDIAAKLATFLADPALRRHLRAGAIETARHYGWPAIAARYGALMTELLNEMPKTTRAKTTGRLFRADLTGSTT